MALHASTAGGRGAALLPVVSRMRRRSSANGGSGTGAAGSKQCKTATFWSGYLLLAVAVTLWLALMNAGLHSGSIPHIGPHVLQHSQSGIQLTDIGRLLLTR